jgi:2'-hydroxyisoflavone reductase
MTCVERVHHNSCRYTFHMNLLILGGTRFVGRHVVTTALERGHRVTVFHRGNTPLENMPDVQHILGDREIDVTLLGTRAWDAIIDTNGYVPKHVRAACQTLANAGHYTFVSTISVHADNATPNADETYPLGVITSEKIAAVDSAKQIDGENYGPLKALCESEVAQAFGSRALIVRPGMIVGPFDYTDRFTYWVRRVAQGGDILVPDALTQRWQFIDGRDLAQFIVTLSENRATGVFGATGPTPDTRMSAGDVLRGIAAVAGVRANFVPLNKAFMEEHDLFSWSNLPFFLPADAPDTAGLYEVNCARAVAAGLRFRPLAETLRDTLAWDRARGGELKMGLSDARHAELLRLLRPTIVA